MIEVTDEQIAGGSRPWTNPFVVHLPKLSFLSAGRMQEIRTGLRIRLEGWSSISVEPDAQSAAKGLYVLAWRTTPELYIAVMSTRDLTLVPDAFGKDDGPLSLLVTVVEKPVVPVRFMEYGMKHGNGIRVIVGDAKEVVKGCHA